MKQYWYQAWYRYVLLTQLKTWLLSCLICTVIEQHCSRLLVHWPGWTVLFHACWQLATGCAFFSFYASFLVFSFLVYRVSGHYNEKNNLCWRHLFSATFSRHPAVQLYYRSVGSSPLHARNGLEHRLVIFVLKLEYLRHFYFIFKIHAYVFGDVYPLGVNAVKTTISYK